MKAGPLCCLLFSCVLSIYAQEPAPLHPGFDGPEYLELLKLGFMQHTMSLSPAAQNPPARPSPPPGKFKMEISRLYTHHYQSPEVGMKNPWDMWYRNDSQVAVINIRGTIGDPLSWLENFYAALVPATGSLELNDSTRFGYQLAADEKALVHIGWLLGLAYLAPTMLEQIRYAYDQGIHAFIIFGHSQGGALTYLTRSYLYYLQQKGNLPADIVFKTYCSAAPKPGNLFYAYDFDFITRYGWGFNIVNAADWVPETPFSVQALRDFNPVNPFVQTDKALKKQSLLVRWYIKGKYNQLDRRSRRTVRTFRNVLGTRVYRQVKKALPGFRQPVYAESSNYQRAGVPIVLQPDSAYYIEFPNLPDKVFQHHLFEPYFLLTSKYYGKAPAQP